MSLSKRRRAEREHNLPTGILDLPPDVLNTLARDYLSLKDVVNLCRANKILSRLCREDNATFWNRVFMRSFPQENASLSEYVERIIQYAKEPIMYMRDDRAHGVTVTYTFDMADYWGDLDAVLNFFKAVPNLMDRAKTWAVATGAARNMKLYGYDSIELVREGELYIDEITFQLLPETRRFPPRGPSVERMLIQGHNVNITGENAMPWGLEFIDITTLMVAYYMYQGYNVSSKIVMLRCMVCSNIAQFQEESNEGNTFCGEQCQREYYSQN